MRILIWGDSPTATTGFGIVNKHIAKLLTNEYKASIDWLAINYDGNPHQLNYRLYPALHPMSAQPDSFGRDYICQMLLEVRPDILFIHLDLFNIAPVIKQIKEIQQKLIKAGHPFQIIGLFPIDGVVHNFEAEIIKEFDFPITYTNWGKDLCLKIDPILDIKVISPGGYSEKDFYPINNPNLKREVFGFNDKFVITSINRNTQRKQLPLLLEALALVKKTHPNVFLYIHANPNEFGLNLQLVADRLGLRYQTDYLTPTPNFAEHKGTTIKNLNDIYNASDLIISAATGEGWGLSVCTEAPATKTLCLLPNIEPLNENLNNNAVYYKADSAAYFENDISRLRPIPDYKDMAIKIKEIIDNQADKKYKSIKVAASKWVKQFTLKEINKKWIDIFNKTLSQLDKVKKNLSYLKK